MVTELEERDIEALWYKLMEGREVPPGVCVMVLPSFHIIACPGSLMWH